MDSSYILCFADDFPSNGLFVLETDNDFVNHLQSNSAHGTVSFKGTSGNAAYCVTPDSTYKLLMSESSNTELLVTPSTSKLNIHSSMTTMQELQESIPVFDLVLNYLNNNLYRGPELSEIEFEHYKDFAYLESVAISSSQELANFLREQQCISLNGKEFTNGVVVKPCITYIDFLLDVVISVCSENQDFSSKINLDDVISDLPSHDPSVVQQILGYFSDSGHICPKALAIHKAKVILRDYESTYMPRELFCSEWSNSMKVMNFVPDFSLLAGIAVSVCVRDEKGNILEEFLTRIEIDSLSFNPLDRFLYLFKIKDQWEITELEPYIKPLVSKEVSMDSLLSKYCRKVIGKKEMVYTKR
ncbi:hypothetical protein P9112_002885 [Eukaryota sp. TZLM1-RC]